MAHFIVSYDLIKRKDYPEIIEALTDLGGVRCLLSQWLVDCLCTADDLLAHLRPHIDSDDRLMVVEFDTKPAATACLKGTRAWIDERF